LQCASEDKEYMPKKQNRKASRSQWERESEKESFWRKQIAAWKASGQTVRSFAKANGFSEPLFYSWCREISIRARELNVVAAAGASPDSPGSANNHVVDARGRVVPLKFRDTPFGTPTTGGGRLSTIKNNGAILTSDITFGYDVLGRLTNRSVNGSANSDSWGYDAISRVTSETSSVLGNFAFSYGANASYGTHELGICQG
jgi:hypothetical protein